MDVLKEQPVFIKYCQKLGKTATETYEMLQQTFRETALSRSKASEWKKARQIQSHVKTMLIAFFDVVGLVHHEFLPQCQTMNRTVYITIPQCLRDAVRHKRSHKWSSSTWLLHQDSVPCHVALSVRELWPSTESPWFPTHLSHQIWPPATSSSFPG
jgi:hypothetical protein